MAPASRLGQPAFQLPQLQELVFDGELDSGFVFDDQLLPAIPSTLQVVG